MQRRSQRGFTVIEAAVALVLAAIGVIAGMEAINSLVRGQTRTYDHERMLRLAREKFEEIVAIQDFTTPGGDFTDRNDPKHVWEMEKQNATLPQSSSSNSVGATAATAANPGQLVTVKVTVHPPGDTAPSHEESVTGVVWESPQAVNGVTGTP